MLHAFITTFLKPFLLLLVVEWCWSVQDAARAVIASIIVVSAVLFVVVSIFCFVSLLLLLLHFCSCCSGGGSWIRFLASCICY